MTERLAILTIGVAVAVGAASSASGDAGRALIAFVATSADSTPSVRLVVPGERRNRILVPGSEVAWSPLGDALAVVTPPDGAGGADLVLVSTGGVVERRLTADVGDERFPSFSPDGSRLAYLALAPALRGTWQARWTLIALDLASGRRTVLADDAVAGRAAWSPDGRSLMYAAWRASSEGLQADLALVAADGSSPVHWLTSTDESERGRIDESGGAWSSDGARIAFIRRPENPNYAGDLWLMRSDGTGEQLLAQRAAQFAWSPDGTQLAFEVQPRQDCSRDCDTSTPIDVVDVATGAIRRLTTTASEHAPVWSPDGAKIAFTSTRDGDTSELYVMNADGTCESRMTQLAASGRDVVQPGWQPGGGSGPRIHCRDLDVSVVSTAGAVLLGGSARVTFRVSNIGDLTASAVRFMIAVPAPLRVMNASVPGGSCVVRRPVVCTLGSVAVHRTRTVTLRFTPPFAAFDAEIGTADRTAVYETLRGSAPNAGESNLGNNAAEAVQTVVSCSIQGTAGDDRIVGTGGPDRICAREGQDVVDGRGGRDVIDGGLGADIIDPGPGRDIVRARSGDDRIDARDGVPDVIACGAGDDSVLADRTDRLIDCEHVSLP